MRLVTLRLLNFSWTYLLDTSRFAPAKVNPHPMPLVTFLVFERRQATPHLLFELSRHLTNHMAVLLLEWNQRFCIPVLWFLYAHSRVWMMVIGSTHVRWRRPPVGETCAVFTLRQLLLQRKAFLLLGRSATASVSPPSPLFHRPFQLMLPSAIISFKTGSNRRAW
jgi:hypothetical protein